MKDIKVLQSVSKDIYADFNDFVVLNNDLQLLENETKLAQDVVKIMLTIKGSNFLFKNYGTNLALLVNARKISQLTDSLKAELIYALEYVKTSNDNEAINLKEILSIDIGNGPNFLNITMKILLTNGKMLTLTA